MKKVWWMAAVALLLPMQAKAADIQPYVSAGLGMFELDPGLDKKSAFGGYIAGGAQLHEYLDAEVRLGSTNTNNSVNKAAVDWFVAALAKPKMQVSSDLTIYALAGLTTLKTSYTRAGGAKQTSTDTAFSFGIGGSYRLNDQVDVGGEWLRYSTKANAATKNTTFAGLDVNGFVANINYRF